MNEPVEDYLDGLLLALPGTAREVRHTLSEVEAHLHDAVAEGVAAAGLTQPEAEAAAVARVGPIHAIAGRTPQFSRPAAALLRRTALGGFLVGGVALVAYGISGGISWAMAAIRGGMFVTAPFPPGSYTRADCARWLAGDPSARTCVAAMTADHVGDIVLQGIAAGFVGALALLAFWVLRTKWQDRSTVTALPVGSAEAAGAILAFLVAAASLLVWANVETVQRGLGAGQPLSIAIAAMGAVAFFGIRLYRSAKARVA
jgi:hypothetical protein